jgi:hypothetical protein
MEQNELMAALAKGLSPFMQKAHGHPDYPVDIYGNTGLFGVCGAESTLINAMVGPLGVERILTWQPSIYDNPIYEALVSITTTKNSQWSGCSSCGKPVYKECAQTYCWGRVCQMTNEQQADQLGMVMNRGVPRLALFGDIKDAGGNVLVARGTQITDQFTLDLAAAAYNLRLDMASMNIIGDPANNVGGRWEPTGLQLIVNTGKVNVLTGTSCPAMDSVLLDFGNDTVGAAGARSIVAYITALVHSINYRLQGAGFSQDGSNVFIVMHPTLWECVSRAWACEYALVCQNDWEHGPGGVVNMSSLDEIARRYERYISTMSLPIDGKDYPVVLDTQIPYTTNTGTRRCSDIYVLTTAVDGQTVLWGEYQDFANTFGKSAAWFKATFGASIIGVSDGGRFMWSQTSDGGFCFDARVLAKWRLVALMPWTSGRVQNVCCSPLGVFPDVTGSGGLYEKDGGDSRKPGTNLYGDCETDTQYYARGDGEHGV